MSIHPQAVHLMLLIISLTKKGSIYFHVYLNVPNSLLSRETDATRTDRKQRGAH